jgi:dTMP kinase
MSARMVPGLFLAPLAGVLVDRWDRRRVMVLCDVSRAAILFGLPFVRTVPQLVLASLLLEVATMLWSPAKEASVPNLVPAGHLTTANSLSMAAAYGTFPVASLLFAALEKGGDRLAHIDALSFFRFGQNGSMAIYADVLTFLASAIFISTLVLPPSRKVRNAELDVDLGSPFRELREGWHFMFTDRIVRTVMIALGAGLIGGGMVVPLGDVFSSEVLHAGSAGFGLLMSAMGFGMAIGVVLLSSIQKRLPKPQVFTFSVLGAGVALCLAAAMSSTPLALTCVGALGLCTGAVYVLGFTILHESVEDDLRGRVFSSLYTLVRVCLLLSFTIGPLLADRFDSLSSIPGVRLALWLASAVIAGAGILSLLSLRTDE